MRALTGYTNGSSFVQTSNVDIRFTDRVPSGRIETIQTDDNAFTGILEGVKTILYRGKTYEFAQTFLTDYGDRSIFVRNLSNGLWTPWTWVGFNSQYGVDQWDICEYRGYICLMYVTNALDLVVAYTQDVEIWNQSLVLASNVNFCSCASYKDQIWYLTKFGGLNKLGNTDLNINNIVNYVATNSAQMSIRYGYNKLLIFDVKSTAGSVVQSYDGVTFSGFTVLAFNTDSWIDICYILGKYYITYRAFATGYPQLANLTSTLTIASTTQVTATYTNAVSFTSFLYNGRVYVGFLNNLDQYVYHISNAINFPSFITTKIVETNYIRINPGVIVACDVPLDEILYIYILKNSWYVYYRYNIIRAWQTPKKYYYELELWQYHSAEQSKLLKMQMYSKRKFINAKN